MDDFFSEEFVLPSDSIRINREAVFRGLDIPLSEVDTYLNTLVGELIAESQQLAAPCGRYGLFKKSGFTQSGQLKVRNQIFSLDKIVYNALKKSSHVAFFIATAGDRIEKYAKELLSDGHSLEGLIVDLIGSEIAEIGAELIHQQITADMDTMEMNTTNRYSPGYCGWPVSDQQQLFSLMQNATCGVRLTDSSLMLPVKSVSGIVGVGKEVKYRAYSCARCDAKFCIYRDKR